jgi:Beta propeller domain
VVKKLCAFNVWLCPSARKQVYAAVLALVLSGCGGGGGGGPTASDGLGSAPVVAVSPASPASSAQPPPASAGVIPAEIRALQASQPGELLAYVRAKLEERQKLRAKNASNNIEFATSGNAESGVVFSAGSAPSPERSSTVVQEEGVDEDDLIKSNGDFIYTLGREAASSGGLQVSRVSIHGRRSDGSTVPAGQLSLSTEAGMSGRFSGMYLMNNQPRLAVLGSNFREMFVGVEPGGLAGGMVALDVVNAEDASRPVAADKLRIDGRLVGSRQIGNSLVLVTKFTPRLAADALPWNASLAEREAAIARLTAAELLPTVRLNNGPSQALMAETDCFVEPKNASYGLEVTSITVVDLSQANLTHSSRCFIGGSQAMYMSTAALYLATTSYSIQPPTNGNTRLVFPPRITTDIHKFSFNKTTQGAVTTVDYRGSGAVPGHLGWSTQQSSFRMSEHNGDLRVLTFTGESGWGSMSDATSPSAPLPSPATLTVLRESSSAKWLQQIGQLPNKERPQPLGKPGEQVYAVRFLGDRGYVVTFRRVDPLYIVDLSKPNDPRTTGELTVAGFSDYLFPVGSAGSGLLLGVGKDADERGVVTGVKVALFDVADPSQPTQRSTVTLGGAGSNSALDSSRHGIDLFTRGNQTRVVLPVAGTDTSLQRFEVDATTRSMKLLTPLSQTTGHRWVGEDRSLQIGDMVHHFIPGNGRDLTGSFSSYTW